MKKNTFSIFLLLITGVGAGWYPFVYYYQDAIYERDRAIYEAEKAQWDSIQTRKATLIEDSVFTYWIAHNDTSLKAIKKITKSPTYGENGYYRKNGKWSCEPESRYSKKLICEPMKEWIVTDYYINGYQVDTTWTTGYNTRNEWINKAHSIAHNEAVRQKQDFRPYDGHKFHWIVAANGPAMTIGLICMLLFGIGFLVAIWFFFPTLISVIKHSIITRK